jgi:carboxymethylenebutenolidase
MVAQSVSAEQTRNLDNRANYVQMKTASNQPFNAYVAGPKDARQAILLIHGWWGLDQDVETWANEYAVAGYRVLAVDLYNQQVTENPATAKELMQAVKQSDANAKYAAAIQTLSANGRKVAIIGRSYGATQVLHAALVAKEKASAAIVYYPYGELMTDKQSLAAIKTPILGHFARKDFFLSLDKVAEFTSAIKNSGVNMSVNMYEARHGFDSPSSSNFDEAAHQLAQQRSNEFLQHYLN